MVAGWGGFRARGIQVVVLGVDPLVQLEFISRLCVLLVYHAYLHKDIHMKTLYSRS